MAKPKTSVTKSDAGKLRLNFSLGQEAHMRLRIAAAALNLSEGDLIESLVLKHLSGVHVRGLTNEIKEIVGAGGAGQGGHMSEDIDPTEDAQKFPLVRIKNVSDRMSEIHRRSTKPVDDALESLED